MKSKICVVTGSRAEYGLLRSVMDGIAQDATLTLQIISTGMHLSPEFGLTYREIEKDGFKIDRKVEMLTSSDSPVGTAKSMGLGMVGIADALQDLNPDMLLVLGDRFEIHAAVAVALVARIPVAHIHGGEVTEGAIDDALRHSITKMSHLHFVAAEEYRTRVIQLGESPDRVFIVGGLGVDAIARTPLIVRQELEALLGLVFGKKSLLVTFHPVTLDSVTDDSQMTELLAVLKEVNDTTLIFTMPNADAGGRALVRMVDDFVSVNPNAYSFTSLGHLRYLSCLAQVDGVVGNSSSGLLEAPTLMKGSINIGDRQKGRLQASSVINCQPERGAIRMALQQLYSNEFQASLENVINPYGKGGASQMIIDVIRRYNYKEIVKKKFYDLSHYNLSDGSML